MLQTIFTEEERQLLFDILESDIAELRMEISDTHRLEYREMLKRREALMKSIQQKLQQTNAEPAAA
ncbi:MAG: hypothetical protein LDL50_03335 [Chloroflexi bacterium]|nr:hypothetical protein [Chloroflexota bacterium]MCA2000530.1 hypothetical protein [Chloroflexota bacterium]